jgi:hypothetical protein
MIEAISSHYCAVSLGTGRFRVIDYDVGQGKRRLCFADNLSEFMSVSNIK